MSQFQRLLFLLWPPYHAHVANRTVLHERQKEFAQLWERTYSAVEAVVVKLPVDQLEAAEKLANEVGDAETKRRDSLEAKAATFISAPTLGTIVAAALTALTGNLRFGQLWTAMLIALYLIAILHLLVATFYAVRVRQVSPLVLPSVNGALVLMAQEKVDRVTTLLAQVRMNEPLLTVKVNDLSVAESLFMRGLALISVAAVVTLLLKIEL